METNEQLRTVLKKVLESELESFLEQVRELAEGDLEQMEERVVKSSQAIGRKLMEGVLNSRLHEQRPVARREGSCGHRQRLVEERPKTLITLVGSVRFVRPYYQCLPVAEQTEEVTCTHGEAPADAIWGVHEQRTTPGVHRLITYLCTRLTFEEAAEALCHCVPTGMSGRQALTLMRPVGAAAAAEEDHQVCLLQAAAQQARCPLGERPTKKGTERFYIELDGVLARMRRGSVPMEKEEQQHTGDVYREIKVGAVFRADRGPRRSELAPGVYVDTPAEGSLRYVARRTAKGGFAWLLYQLAVQGGLEEAQQVVVLGDGAPWMREPGCRTLPSRRADCGFLPCHRACVGGGPRRLWTRLRRSHDLGHHRLLTLGRGADRTARRFSSGVAAHCARTRTSTQYSNARGGLLFHQRRAYALSYLSRSRDAHWQWHRRGCL